MSKANYASISGILLQRCQAHGSWADHDGAVRLVELMANGGDTNLLELAAAQNEAELARKLERLELRAALQDQRLGALDLRSRVHLVLDWFGFM